MNQRGFARMFLREDEDQKKFIAINKGREGKTLLGIDGKEIAGKIYLGDGAYAYKDNTFVRVVIPGAMGKNETSYIPLKVWDHLKKSKF